MPENNEKAGGGSQRITVAGIGASAGGIEALCQFFETVPTNLGLAFVVIVQDRKSVV